MYQKRSLHTSAALNGNARPVTNIFLQACTMHVTWSSNCPCCSSGALLLAAKLARMQVRSASGLKIPASGTCATTQADLIVPAGQGANSK